MVLLEEHKTFLDFSRLPLIIKQEQTQDRTKVNNAQPIRRRDLARRRPLCVLKYHTTQYRQDVQYILYVYYDMVL
jgi:hypothetical protein